MKWNETNGTTSYWNEMNSFWHSEDDTLWLFFGSLDLFIFSCCLSSDYLSISLSTVWSCVSHFHFHSIVFFFLGVFEMMFPCSQHHIIRSLTWSYQVLSMLPPYEGKSVMELGAGIGRFTGELAQKAGQLIAMDFIDNVIKKVLLLTRTRWPFFVASQNNFWYTTFRMKASMDTIRTSSSCVLMWHHLTWIYLTNQWIWYSQIGFLCIYLIRR